ncbi:class II SORL domain-containing protein [Spirochaeta thermophila]|nr:class II SORL domain-containing protein [Spirochaeta thermophila]
MPARAHGPPRLRGDAGGVGEGRPAWIWMVSGMVRRCSSVHLASGSPPGSGGRGALLAPARARVYTFPVDQNHEEERMALGEWIKSDDFKTEKHVPVIELPREVKKGEAVLVTVTVGKEIPHPNTTEHFIQWIRLYYKDVDGKFAIDLGCAEFNAHGATTAGPNTGPAYTEPVAVFKVKLDTPGTLVAESYCNIHGLWESSVEVKPEA